MPSLKRRNSDLTPDWDTSAERVGSTTGAKDFCKSFCGLDGIVDGGNGMAGEDDTVFSVNGSEVVMGPLPKMIQSRLYSGNVSLIFFTKSRLG